MKKHTAVKAGTKKLRLTLLKSVHGQLKMHRDNLRGLGLRRRHHTVEVPVNPAVMGMVRETAWMLKVEEV